MDEELLKESLECLMNHLRYEAEEDAEDEGPEQAGRYFDMLEKTVRCVDKLRNRLGVK